MPARPLGEPVTDELRLVAGGVVHHDMDAELRRHAPLDGVKETAELGCPARWHALVDDGTALPIERREESG